MADKTFKVGDGDEIIVTIRGKKKPDAVLPSGAKKKGIIEPHRPDEFLPRRFSNQSYIQFYDLGQLAGAEYIDNPYKVIPEVVYDNSSSNLNVGSVLTISDYRAREAIFINNLATLETTYRRLKKNDSEPFGIAALGRNESNQSIILASLNQANPNWTNTGLNLTPEQLANSGFGIGSPQFNYTFNLKGTFVYPITNEPDPLADIVSFTPTNTDKYFLLPSFYFIYLQNSKDSGSITYLQYLNYFYGSRPRNYLVDPSSEFYGYSLNGTWNNGGTLAAYEAADEGGRIARAYPGARMFETHGSGTSWIWEENTAPVNFNNPAYSSLYPVYPDGNYLLSNHVALGLLPSILLAIIKQGENVFYVWNFAD